MDFLHVIVPQGTAENPKKEGLFLQFLQNLHKTAHHKHLSFELFGYNQYTYFFIGCEPDITKLVEGLIYSSYPDAEIRPVKDYTTVYDPKKHILLGTSARFAMSDIYPFKAYDEFEVDSLSSIFSVISKLGRNDHAWVQILTVPIDEDWKYHFLRKFRMRLNRFLRRFRLKNYVRMKEKSEYYKEEEALFIHKSEHETFKVQIRL